MERIRKYSVLWWLKNIGTGVLMLFLFLLAGLVDAPDTPDVICEPEPVRIVKYVPAEEPGNPIELSTEERIELACIDYGVDSDIALAIARLETGHFTSKAYTEYNNVGGMSYNEVPIKYDSLEDGIEAFVSNLAGYKAKGLDTVEEIGEKWCPVNYDNWVSIVNQIMEEHNV